MSTVNVYSIKSYKQPKAQSDFKSEALLEPAMLDAELKELAEEQTIDVESQVA
jgi:hypothetical protein